ncbi:hypothetical protein P3T26_007315 [Streptomyces sp. MAA16]|nr:hypothetical protein [Streptomyces sp. MAA16]
MPGSLVGDVSVVPGRLPVTPAILVTAATLATPVVVPVVPMTQVAPVVSPGSL